MLPLILLVGILSFLLGVVINDHKWVKASKTGKVMVVDGNLYKVKPYAERTGGSVE